MCLLFKKPLKLCCMNEKKTFRSSCASHLTGGFCCGYLRLCWRVTSFAARCGQEMWKNNLVASSDRHRFHCPNEEQLWKFLLWFVRKDRNGKDFTFHTTMSHSVQTWWGNILPWWIIDVLGFEKIQLELSDAAYFSFWQSWTSSLALLPV